jgi:hypothetical protein
MGFPAIVARAFPGKREEANRAGITPRIRVGTIDHSTTDLPQNPKKTRKKLEGTNPIKTLGHRYSMRVEIP